MRERRKKIERQNGWIHSICLWHGKWLMAAANETNAWNVFECIGDAISFHCYRISAVIFFTEQNTHYGRRMAFLAVSSVISIGVEEYFCVFFFFELKHLIPWSVAYAVTNVDTEVWNSSYSFWDVAKFPCGKCCISGRIVCPAGGINWILWKRGDRSSNDF